VYSPMEIFVQAERSSEGFRAESSTDISHLLHGMKLIYDKRIKTVTILNTTQAIHYDKEVKSHEYLLFNKWGWMIGVYEMALRNYKRKLKIVESKIKVEVNSRKNDKKMKALKQSRLLFMNRFAKVSKKMNLLTN